jgi:hypothetical protein
MNTLSLELKDDTKWDKCQIKNLDDMYDHLTEIEKEILSKMSNCVVECHSEQCDAGGKCDIHKNKETQFYIVFEEEFKRFEIQQTHARIKSELPSLENFISVEESDGKLGVHGTADERQLKLWLKNKGYPLSVIDRTSKSPTQKLEKFVPFEIP